MVTFHPVTLEQNTSDRQMNELLSALGELQNVGLIFTMPNADPEGRILFQQIKSFCSARQNARVYTSLGQLLYLSCIKHVDGVIGNSSSGLIEVPSFKKGTINIGDRQRGRLKANSVIDCEPDCQAIKVALEHLYSTAFQAKLPETKNPYGDGGASDLIVETLKSHPLENLLKSDLTICLEI